MDWTEGPRPGERKCVKASKKTINKREAMGKREVEEEVEGEGGDDQQWLLRRATHRDKNCENSTQTDGEGKAPLRPLSN